MFVVIFEVRPREQRFDEYLAIAKSLRPHIEKIDGFIDNERLASMRRPGAILSLSTWRDEKAVVRWRTVGEHRGVQERGRLEIFEDYHLSVGEITRDSDPPHGLPIVEKRFDETEVGTAKVAVIAEFTPQPSDEPGAKAQTWPARLGLNRDRDGLVDVEAFESIYNPGKIVVLALWRDAVAANSWEPPQPTIAETPRLRHVRIIRDYGMFDRREAPQFFREVRHAACDAAR